MIDWILAGEHQTATYHKDPVFNLSVPDHIEGIPQDLLYPQNTWDDPAHFIQVANDLRNAFEENFENFIPFLSGEPARM